MLSREYAKEKYAEILGLPIEHAIVQNLEKCTSNWTYNYTLERGDTPASNNREHVRRYKQKFLSMMFNLKNSPNLKDRVLKGELKTSQLVNLSPQGLWPGGPHAKMTEKIADKEMLKQHASNILNDPEYKGLFRCNRCKSYKTTYYEMQTRSADEPMTVFITCHNCNSRWKS